MQAPPGYSPWPGSCVVWSAPGTFLPPKSKLRIQVSAYLSPARRFAIESHTDACFIDFNFVHISAAGFKKPNRSDDELYSAVIADSAEASVAGLVESVAAVGDIASGCGPEQSRPQGIQGVREVGVAAAVAAAADRIAGSLQNRLRFRRRWVEKGLAASCRSSAHSG